MWVWPGQLSPCHLCGRSVCSLSVQSNAAASSWLKTSVVSWASQPSAASPWTWRSAVSPGQGLPLQGSHSWIELPNTTREKLEKQIYQSPMHCHNRSNETLPKHQHCSFAAEHFPFFHMNMHQPIKVERPAQHSLFLLATHRLQAERKLLVRADPFPVEDARMQLWFYISYSTNNKLIVCSVEWSETDFCVILRLF